MRVKALKTSSEFWGRGEVKEKGKRKSKSSTTAWMHPWNLVVARARSKKKGEQFRAIQGASRHASPFSDNILIESLLSTKQIPDKFASKSMWALWSWWQIGPSLTYLLLLLLPLLVPSPKNPNRQAGRQTKWAKSQVISKWSRLLGLKMLPQAPQRSSAFIIDTYRLIDAFNR